MLTGLLTWHDALRRHLYVTGLTDNATCRRRGAGKETTAQVLCKCEAVASITH